MEVCNFEENLVKGLEKTKGHLKQAAISQQFRSSFAAVSQQFRSNIAAISEQTQLKQIHHLTIKAAAAAIVVLLLFTFINAQYARAVGTHKLLAPLSREVRHPVKTLIRSRFYRGDMINSYQPSQFSVTVLCPQELALLIRQIARGIHLSGLIAGLYRIMCAAASLRASLRSALQSMLTGATIFGCALMAPDYIRALSMWSLGYAPF